MSKLDFMIVSLVGCFPIGVAYLVSKCNFLIYQSVLLGILTSLIMLLVFVKYYALLINGVKY